jgi:hypothetical protein
MDVDLATILTKLRPSTAGIPVQLNSNLNAILYAGVRKDFYIIRTRRSVLNATHSFIRQLGYDAGLFAGVGITPINPTVTDNHTSLEYEGVVFQKDVAAFITIDRMSVGLTIGFDNLMGSDSKYWVYNNKPWIGFAIGIANF